MPDIYVEVGPMAISKDPTKVGAKYAAQAKKLMRDAATKAIQSAPGFTTDKKGNPTGFHVDATLTEITFGQYQGGPSVTCKVNGVVLIYPKMELLSSSLNGKAMIAGDTSDGAVYDCITEAMKATMTKAVIPALKK